MRLHTKDGEWNAWMWILVSVVAIVLVLFIVKQLTGA